MGSLESVHRHLTEAADAGVLVRIFLKPRHASPIDVFVVGVGSKWVLGVGVSEGYFDGHVAVRRRDIERVRRDTSFMTRMARTLPEWPPVFEPDADLHSTAAALKWFASRYSLVGIEKAHERSALWIGAVGAFESKWFQLHEVDARANWKLSPLYYRRRAVTQITGGSRYLLALGSIAGPQPAIDPSRSSQ